MVLNQFADVKVETYQQILKMLTSEDIKIQKLACRYLSDLFNNFPENSQRVTYLDCTKAITEQLYLFTGAEHQAEIEDFMKLVENVKKVMMQHLRINLFKISMSFSDGFKQGVKSLFDLEDFVNQYKIALADKVNKTLLNKFEKLRATYRRYDLSHEQQNKLPKELIAQMAKIIYSI